MKSQSDNLTSSPAALVAIARAAYLTGDRELERTAKRQLQDEFGIHLRFDRALKLSQGNVKETQA
jgi:hypothetical protein